MPIPTEPIGSIPRPAELQQAMAAHAAGNLGDKELRALQQEVVRETIQRFEATGSPVITDGEQTKPSFISYPLAGLTNLAADGVVIPFADGHTRQLPKLAGGPFRYATHADTYTREAKKLATRPVKQAVIAASAISLIYPQEGLEGYSRDQFVADLVAEAQKDIRGALDAGAHNVQVDFTEGRLSVKLDPSKGLLRSFIDLNNQVLDGFSDADRSRLGVHTCPGGDQDSTHSADVDYADLLPDLFRLNVGNVYVQMASEKDRPRVLQIIKDAVRPGQRVFVGVTDPIDPRVESPEEVRDRVLEAAEYLGPDQLGTGDDCGFSPFGDDTSTSRDTAFEKVRNRVEGTQMASEKLGL
ncbi:MAG: cobalamin-independent methionine synthase II family protein [Actinobacteria bacterium]|nr:MAG: cobalamin-independent methionine synthase II family protein [Actinomycetota bacterium]